MASIISRYGLNWPEGWSPLRIELECIKQGGRWGKGQFGAGMYHHFKTAMTMLWPEDDWHRWIELGLKAVCENDITVFVGAGDTGKTFLMAKWALVDWWADPQNTLTLISSTEIRGAQLRIWGNVKEMLNRARARFPDLPGVSLESMKTITYQELDDDDDSARSLRSGLILIPCISGGKYVGMGRFVGMKAKRLRHIGDEVQHMRSSFLDAYDNWYGKGDFKGLMAGNPLDCEDPLGVASEPIDGWTSFMDTGKTQTWRSKWFDAFVVNFDGRDSPNDDFPQDQPPRYPYLVGKKKRDAIAKTYGADSWHYFWQCAGKMKPGMLLNRVINREMCRKHKAHDAPIWKNEERTQIYALDPAYGGGDRCVGGKIEFGLDSDGNQILDVFDPEIVPIDVGSSIPVDDQIAAYIKSRLAELGIPVENCFWDSFGKGTLGFAFAKVFGASTPNPIDSGARPTRRPVRFDFYVWDEAGRENRLKRCDEHYSKFVTEMWFSVSETIQSEQMRSLPEEVMAEMCKREYRMVMGNKLEIEPKADYKERVGYSPDLGDWLSLGVEGARQRGFQIRRIGQTEDEDEGDDWLRDRVKSHVGLMKSKMLMTTGR